MRRFIILFLTVFLTAAHASSLIYYYVQFELIAKNAPLADFRVKSLILRPSCYNGHCSRYHHRTLHSTELKDPNSIYAYLQDFPCNNLLADRTDAVELKVVTRDGTVHKCGRKKGGRWIDSSCRVKGFTEISVFLTQTPNGSLACSWQGKRTYLDRHIYFGWR